MLEPLFTPSSLRRASAALYSMHASSEPSGFFSVQRARCRGVGHPCIPVLRLVVRFHVFRRRQRRNVDRRGVKHHIASAPFEQLDREGVRAAEALGLLKLAGKAEEMRRMRDVQQGHHPCYS